MSIVTTILWKNQAPFNRLSTPTTTQITWTAKHICGVHVIHMWYAYDDTYVWFVCDTHVVCMWYLCDVHVIAITFHFLFLFSRCRLWQPFYGRTGTFQSPVYPDNYPNNLNCQTHMWCACDIHVVCIWWYLCMVCVWYPCGVHVISM